MELVWGNGRLNYISIVVRKINFGNGYINVTDDKIAYYLGNNHQIMDRICLGTVKSVKKTFLLKDSWTYSLRLVFYGLILIVLGTITIGLVNPNLGVFISCSGLAVGLYGFIAHFMFIFSTMIGSEKPSSFMIKIIFGIKGYEVTIYNTGGGKNIIFNIHESDKNKVNSIIQYKLDKNPIPQENINSDLSDIEKLSDLYQKGILSEEEFSLKKKQLLNIQ